MLIPPVGTLTKDQVWARWFNGWIEKHKVPHKSLSSKLGLSDSREYKKLKQRAPLAAKAFAIGHDMGEVDSDHRRTTGMHALIAAGLFKEYALILGDVAAKAQRVKNMCEREKIAGQVHHFADPRYRRNIAPIGGVDWVPDHEKMLFNDDVPLELSDLFLESAERYLPNRAEPATKTTIIASFGAAVDLFAAGNDLAGFVQLSMAGRSWRMGSVDTMLHALTEYDLETILKRFSRVRDAWASAGRIAPDEISNATPDEPPITRHLIVQLGKLIETIVEPEEG